MFCSCLHDYVYGHFKNMFDGAKNDIVKPLKIRNIFSGNLDLPPDILRYNDNITMMSVYSGSFYFLNKTTPCDDVVFCWNSAEHRCGLGIDLTQIAMCIAAYKFPAIRWRIKYKNKENRKFFEGIDGADVNLWWYYVGHIMEMRWFYRKKKFFFSFFTHFNDVYNKAVH